MPPEVSAARRVVSAPLDPPRSPDVPYSPGEPVWQALIPAYLLLVGFAVGRTGVGLLPALFAGVSVACHLAGLVVSRRIAGHVGAGALLLVATAGLMGGQPLLVVLSGILVPLVVYASLPIDEAIGWGVAVVMGLAAFSLRIWAVGDGSSAMLAFTGIVVAGVAATVLLVLVGARVREEQLQARLDRAVAALDVGARRIGSALGDRDAALEASHSKDAFLSLLSFELRTPLTTIVGYSEMLAELLEELEAEEGADDARAIRRSSTSLLGIVDDVMDLARLDGGAVEVRTHPVDPAAIVSYTVKEASLTVQAEAAVLDVQPTGLVLADGQRLGQLVRVLTSRAMKRSKGLGPVRVGLAWSDDGSQLVLQIEDANRVPAQIRGARAGLEMRYALALCDVMGGELERVERASGSAIVVQLPLISALGRTGAGSPRSAASVPQIGDRRMA